MLLLISSPRFAHHETPPGHPERPERAEVMDVIAARWRERGGETVAPSAATDEQLARVHDPEYLEMLAGIAGSARALDLDTFTSPDTIEIARLAAGAVVDAVNRVVGGPEGTRAFALVRPPGHHAERNRAMGFCVYNNIAVGAAQALALGLSRVAVIDYDVHHGNGTQHMFEADSSVLYISAHQFPFYPGTGGAGEVGRGEGAGFTVNLPLEAGAVDQDYRIAFQEIALPILHQYRPQLVMISAGFDAHERDPLAGMRLTPPAFAALTSELVRVAEEHCEGRVVAVIEGGYDLPALGASIQATVDALAAARSSSSIVWPAETDVPAVRGPDAAAAARKALGAYWKL